MQNSVDPSYSLCVWALKCYLFLLFICSFSISQLVYHLEMVLIHLTSDAKSGREREQAEDRMASSGHWHCKQAQLCYFINGLWKRTKPLNSFTTAMSSVREHWRSHNQTLHVSATPIHFKGYGNSMPLHIMLHSPEHYKNALERRDIPKLPVIITSSTHTSVPLVKCHHQFHKAATWVYF